MNRKYLRLLGLMSACAFLTSCSLLPEEEVRRTAPILRDTPPQVYNTAFVQRGDLVQTERISARYVPVQKQSLSFALENEYVDQIMVNTGDFVKKGQILGQLKVDALQKQIESVENSAKELELRLAYLEQEYALALKRHALETDGQSRESIQKSLLSLEERFDERRSSLQDQLSLNRITMENLLDKLEERQLRAPFDGTITYVKKYKEGHLTAYGEPAITIADSTVTLFRAETKNWSAYQEGSLHEIEINGELHQLEVVSEETLGIESGKKEIGKKAYVYFQITNPIMGLEDDAYGTINMELNRRENVLYVPSSAIATAGDISLVYYQREDGLKGYKEVEVGITIDRLTEIVSGLSEGEEIIVN